MVGCSVVVVLALLLVLEAGAMMLAWDFHCLIRAGCRRYGMLQSFFFGAIAPYTFLRESPLTLFVKGSAGSGRRVFIYCEFLTGESTPFKGSCPVAVSR